MLSCEGLAIRNALGQQSPREYLALGRQRDIGVYQRRTAESTPHQDIHVAPARMSKSPVPAAQHSLAEVQLAIAEGLVQGVGELTRMQLSAPLEQPHRLPARANRDAAIAPPYLEPTTTTDTWSVISSRGEDRASTADWAGAIRCWCIGTTVAPAGSVTRLAEVQWSHPEQNRQGYEPEWIPAQTQ